MKRYLGFVSGILAVISYSLFAFLSYMNFPTFYSPMSNWLSDYWQSHCTFQSEPEVPWTNNSTERAIGRMKMRARTIRGYKSWPGMQSGLILAGTLTN